MARPIVGSDDSCEKIRDFGTKYRKLFYQPDKKGPAKEVQQKYQKKKRSCKKTGVPSPNKQERQAQKLQS